MLWFFISISKHLIHALRNLKKRNMEYIFWCKHLFCIDVKNKRKILFETQHIKAIFINPRWNITKENSHWKYFEKTFDLKIQKHNFIRAELQKK